MNAPALSVSGLWVRPCEAGASALVQDVSFDIAVGGRLALIGESGSGKSLVAQALFGLLPPELEVAGTLTVGAGPPIGLDDRAGLRRLWASRLFLIPQEPAQALNPTMTIGGQIAESFDHCGRADRRVRTQAALASVDLDPDIARRYPVALSGGMNQRALAAIAAAVAADVIIADEPTKGLDGCRAAQVTELLGGLVDRGKALIVITHDIAVARRLGGEVAVMQDGCIVERGPAAEVLDAPSHPYARAYMAALPARWRALEVRPDLPEAVVTANDLRFAYPGAAPLFEGLSLSARAGRTLAVVGPSGIGKTTLGDVLLGRRAPARGDVRWGKLDPYRCARADLLAARPRHQKLFQDPGAAFAPHRRLRSAFEDLTRIVRGLDLTERLPGLLDRLKLGAGLLDRFPHEVSGGEAQRLALARILLLDPAFIVADEPTSRLDPIVQAETIGLLREIAAESGLALLLISHDQALVRAVADEVIELGALAPGVRR